MKKKLVKGDGWGLSYRGSIVPATFSRLKREVVAETHAKILANPDIRIVKVKLVEVKDGTDE